MKKKIAALALACALTLTACSGEKPDNGGSGKPESDKIVIGGLGPLTGSVAVYGITSTNGIKLAVKEINAAGGIMGKQIEYILEDEKGEPTEAVNAFNKLKDKKMTALIGDITSKPTLAVAPLAEEAKIPMITPTGTQFDITQGKNFVFRTCYTDPFQGNILAQFVKENLKLKTVAIMSNNSDDYSKGVAKTFKDKAKEIGLEIVADEGYGKDDKDFRAQLTNIVSKNPDVLMISDYYEADALIATQAREVGIKSVIVGPDGWDGVLKQLDESSKTVVEGAYFANHYSVQDKNEKVQKFVKAYKDEYKDEPSSFAALGYDTVYVLKQAIEEAKSEDGEKIAEQIKKIKFEGVTGKFSFDESNNPIKAVTMMKIKDGKYTFDSVVLPK